MKTCFWKKQEQETGLVIGYQEVQGRQCKNINLLLGEKY